MAEKELKVKGTVDPTKKPSWLKEVKLDAARNTVEHLRRQKEAQEFEHAKARGLTIEEVVSKGREDLDLDLPENDFEDEPSNTGSDRASDSQELAELKKELQKERAARTKAENKLKAKEDEESEPKQPEQPQTPETEAK